MAVITTDGLSKRYGELVAVDHLDLEIQHGEVFGLLGPNGAGKTTTILMLLGLTEPSAGSATVLGLDPTRQPLRVKRRVGYLPDSVGFYGKLSARDNLRYIARLNRVPAEVAEPRIDELLGTVGLRHVADDPVETFSRGMKQRLGIADILVKDPQVLVLDEPTIAIDPRGVEEMLALIRRLRDERGMTILLSSHLLHQVQAVCDRVGIFVRGRLVAEGTIDALAARLADAAVTVEVAVGGHRQGAADLLRSLDGVRWVREDDDLLVVGADRDVRREVAAHLARLDVPLLHLRLRGGELDEIYQRYFEEDGDGRDD